MFIPFIDCCKVRLEVQTHTQDRCEGTRIDAALDTVLDFRIKTIILGDGEDVLCSSIDTAADVGVEELVERVSYRDVVNASVGMLCMKFSVEPKP